MIPFIVSLIHFIIYTFGSAFLSRTIKVSDNQKVIDTGLYGIVRHPMYLATIFLF